MPQVQYPKPTINNLSIDSSDLTVPAVDSFRFPADAILRWITINSTAILAGVIAPPPPSFVRSYVGFNISDVSVNAKGIPNSGLLWREDYVIPFAPTLEVVPTPLARFCQIDCKDIFVKANDIIVCKSISSGTTAVNLSVSIAWCTASEWENWSYSSGVNKRF